MSVKDLITGIQAWEECQVIIDENPENRYNNRGDALTRQQQAETKIKHALRLIIMKQGGA